jgi:hypothetical protein
VVALEPHRLGPREQVHRSRRRVFSGLVLVCGSLLLPFCTGSGTRPCVGVAARSALMTREGGREDHGLC